MNRVLTIGGSDCSSGAGIQADLQAFSENKVMGTTVITCITAQNFTQVKQIFVVPIEIIKSQMDAVFEACPIEAVKIGMLFDISVIEAVHERLNHWKPPFIVVDPVMRASTGASLLDSRAIETLKRFLLPIASILTPNIPEVESLLERRCEDFVQAGKNLLDLGPKAVLIKGGHHPTQKGWDCFMTDGCAPLWLKQKTIPNRDVRGTGCRLSSAIAAFLARGYSLIEAVSHGKSYVHRFIQG